ncbi:MAG: hypothetical protein WC787_05195 [Patescibacteria group bacterium]
MANQNVRRINPLEVGIDLIINIVESFSEDMEKKAGWDVSGLKLLGDGVKTKTLSFLNENQSLMPFFETGLKTMIFAAMPSIGIEGKTAVNALLDLYTDGVRKAMSEQDDNRSEAIIAQSGASFKSGMTKTLDEAAKHRKAKPSYAAIVQQLEDHEKNHLLLWVGWMDREAKDHYKTWSEYKGQIASIEELRYLLSIMRTWLEDTTVARLDYLRMVYGKESNLAESVQDSLRRIANGEETPQTKAIQKKIDSVHTSLVRDRHETEAMLAAQQRMYGTGRPRTRRTVPTAATPAPTAQQRGWLARTFPRLFR